ncbi:tetratricopeptide repeat protein, partial [Sphingomonas sp.]|uniref:tetratricopeptide repeat protein n=1 Tax=Sphingomonas sp. TaxID=28214 RepID=UPI0035C7E1E7
MLTPSVFGGPAAAQAPGPAPVQTTPVPTPDADQLAAAMRRVGENPRDVQALLTAGELSLRLGDAGGAASLFKRAEAIEPMNGRVRAGMARILVTQERPGEALRYFDQAIGFGLDPRTFAGDRGLAYDLIGEQERAQRDYRLALKSEDSDEVRRRYALSLGISGRREQALAQIETLVRRNDRGAWRARAFILAMTGDVPGANAIATGMMPPNMAQGMAPFFARLAAIPATDRAFAVHFGEVRPTPERLADARLIPALPPLGPDPDARVAVAQAPAAPIVEESSRDRR